MKKVLLIIFSTTLMFSCNTMHTKKYHGLRTLPIKAANYEVLGNIRVECISYGIFGLTPEMSLIRLGTASSYDELMRQAKNMGGNDVLNVKIDVERMYLPPLTTYRKWIANAVVIRYKNNPKIEKK